jgi:hypothetical protein
METAHSISHSGSFKQRTEPFFLGMKYENDYHFEV